MPKRSSKLPRDPNQLAAHVVALSTGQDAPVRSETKETTKEKNPAAVALGRLGGMRGGVARASSLSPQKRSEIAKKAAKARWTPQGDKTHQ